MIQALTEILQQVSLADCEQTVSNESVASPMENHVSATTTASQEETQKKRFCLVFLRTDEQQHTQHLAEIVDGAEPSITPNPVPVSTNYSSLTEEAFHKNLAMERFANIDDVQKRLVENIKSLKSEYGVLQYLYSVLLTKVVSI